MLILTRADQRELSVRFVCREKPRFTCGVARRFHDQEAAVAGAPGAKVEALIVILIDQHIRGMRCSARMPPKLILALLFFILHGVEER